MRVFHVFKIVQMVPNRATHHKYHLKTPEKLWFSGVFREYKMETLAKNGLNFCKRGRLLKFFFQNLQFIVHNKNACAITSQARNYKATIKFSFFPWVEWGGSLHSFFLFETCKIFQESLSGVWETLSKNTG